MPTWKATFECEIKARSFDSALKKLAALEKRVKAKDIHTPHVAMRGEKS